MKGSPGPCGDTNVAGSRRYATDRAISWFGTPYRGHHVNPKLSRRRSRRAWPPTQRSYARTLGISRSSVAVPIQARRRSFEFIQPSVHRETACGD